MKKQKLFLLLTALFLGSVLYIEASGRWSNAPESSNGSPVEPEYGGLFYSTSAFSVNGATITGNLDIQGVYFSSGLASDYVSIWVTTSPTGGTSIGSAQEIYRLYNVANSTNAFAPGALGEGWSPVVGNSRGALRTYQTVIWFVNTAVHNLVVLLYNQ